MADPKRPTPQEMVKAIDQAITSYKGNVNQLEQAIGAWFVGQHFGWKVLYLMHDRKTMKRAQEILGVDFQAELPEVGARASKSGAWKAFGSLKSFWKAVKGEIPGIKSPDIK